MAPLAAVTATWPRQRMALERSAATIDPWKGCRLAVPAVGPRADLGEHVRIQEPRPYPIGKTGGPFPNS
jgi:hypothetical protein